MAGFRRIVERSSVRAYVHPRLEEAPVANLVRAFIPTLGNIPFARKQSSSSLDNADATQRPLRFATVRSVPVSSRFQTFQRLAASRPPKHHANFVRLKVRVLVRSTEALRSRKKSIFREFGAAKKTGATFHRVFIFQPRYTKPERQKSRATEKIRAHLLAR